MTKLYSKFYIMIVFSLIFSSCNNTEQAKLSSDDLSEQNNVEAIFKYDCVNPPNYVWILDCSSAHNASSISETRLEKQ